jgi:hypothetical protein
MEDPMTTALPLADLEQVYDALADAIDHTGTDSERFLAKLALLLAQELGDGARVRALIAVAAPDL